MNWTILLKIVKSKWFYISLAFIGLTFYSGFLYWQNTRLETQKIELENQNKILEASLQIQKNVNTHYIETIKQLQNDYSELSKDIQLTNTQTIETKKVEIHDVSKDTGIPKYLGNIGF